MPSVHPTSPRAMVELNMMPSFLMPGGRWAYSSQKYTSGPPITSSPITLSIGIGYAAARSLNSATSARRSPTPNAVSAAFCSGDASCAGIVAEGNRVENRDRSHAVSGLSNLVGKATRRDTMHRISTTVSRDARPGGMSVPVRPRGSALIHRRQPFFCSAEWAARDTAGCRPRRWRARAGRRTRGRSWPRRGGRRRGRGSRPR